jgi:hyperosmotically inducible protein
MHKLPGTIALLLLLLTGGALIVAQQAQPAAPSATVQTQQSGNSQAQEADESLSPQSMDRLIREVRHALLMLPYYGVFDNLAYRINGSTVTLEGQVANSILKPDAEKAVKRIEGVDKVVNNIEVLPPSPMDERIRRDAYQHIYGYGPLFKYANMTIPPIHIIVKNARITLVGVVDNEADKNLAGIRANQIPSVFQVTNNLRVVNPRAAEKK